MITKTSHIKTRRQYRGILSTPKPRTVMLVNGLQVPEAYSIYQIRDILQLDKLGKVKPASFERKIGAWKDLQKKELISSVLHRFSIPNLTAINSGDNSLEWVDGLQRWEDISDFLTNQMKITFPKDKLIHGKYFKYLPKQIQEQILNCPLVIKEFLLDENDQKYEERRNFIREYYIKQNSKTYNTTLNNAEIRTARYENSEFRKAVVSENRKMTKFYKTHNIMKGNMKERSYDEELTAELMVLVTEKAQSSGKKLDTYYEIFSKQYPKKKEAVAKLDHIILGCLPKILGKHKLSEIQMNTFNHVYALVGWCINADEGGIEPPVDSFKRLDDFMKEVSSISSLVKKAKTDEEREKVFNTNAGQYWKTTQEGTRSKRNREIRIKCLGKAIMRN